MGCMTSEDFKDLENCLDKCNPVHVKYALMIVQIMALTISIFHIYILILYKN
jgi:hypothetical protein